MKSTPPCDSAVNSANHNPLVSIVVPTYNRRAMLGETLASIFNQTFCDFELIVVDNMSQDGTADYVQGLQDKRVQYYRNENHGVIAVNRNFGIRKAMGKYVAFCDDDDLWLPEKLKKQIGVFEAVGISVVATNYEPFGDVQVLRKNIAIKSSDAYRDYAYAEILLGLNPIISSSVIVKRECLLECGGFDESADFRFIEDWELWLRLSVLGKIRVLAEPLLRYRMLKKEGRDLRAVARATLKILEKHKRQGLMTDSLYRKASGNCAVLIGKACLDANDPAGLSFFGKGLVSSTGFYNKMKSMMGLFLFMIPTTLRRKMLNRAYLFMNQRRETKNG